MRNSKTKLLELLCLERRQHDFRQLQFLGEIFIGENLMLEESSDNVKIISGVEIAEAELADDSHRSDLHAAKEIDQIAVEVVKNLKGVNCRLSEQYATRTAEYIYEPAVVKREQVIDDV